MSSARELFQDPAAVQHIARLARLELDPSTLARVAHDVGEVLASMARLEAVDTTGVPPTVLAGETNRLREPGARRPLPPGSHLANAPDHEDAAFRVPRVL